MHGSTSNGPTGAPPAGAAAGRADAAKAAAAVDAFFAGHDDARALFDAVWAVAVAVAGEPVTLRFGKSEIALGRAARPFARLWRPAQYLGRGAPLVLTLGFRHRDPSPRWKSIVEPAPGRFTHHLELRDPSDVDDEVRRWLAAAWADAA